MTAYDVAEVIETAAVAAFANLHKESTRGVSRKLLERLANKGEKRVELRGACVLVGHGQTRLCQHPLDRSVMHVKLACDRVRSALLGLVTAQNLGFELRIN